MRWQSSVDYYYYLLLLLLSLLFILLFFIPKGGHGRPRTPLTTSLSFNLQISSIDRWVLVMSLVEDTF